MTGRKGLKEHIFPTVGQTVVDPEIDVGSWAVGVSGFLIV